MLFSTILSRLKFSFLKILVLVFLCVLNMYVLFYAMCFGVINDESMKVNKSAFAPFSSVMSLLPSAALLDSRLAVVSGRTGVVASEVSAFP